VLLRKRMQGEPMIRYLEKIGNNTMWLLEDLGRMGSFLVLGLGGGSAAMRGKALWPQAEVTGGDVDPLMSKLGRKYLGLTGVKVVIEDASNFTINAHRKSQKYDLILVDVYLGSNYPPEFERDDFLNRIKSLLTPNGLAVFNRLYYGEKRPAAMRFGTKLEKVFARVDYIFPEANVMFVCSATIE